MSEQLLTILKLCLLVLLYLFFFRVLRAVWIEIHGPRKLERRPAPAPVGAGPIGPVPAGGGNPGKPGKPAKVKRGRKAPATQLTVIDPPEQRGRTYPLGQELTVGRAAGCQVVLDDTYASQIHARVFSRDSQVFVEDLGSTNGTLLNRNQLTGPTMANRGDKMQVGSTVMEFT